MVIMKEIKSILILRYDYVVFDNGLRLDIDTIGWTRDALIEYGNVIVRMKNELGE